MNNPIQIRDLYKIIMNKNDSNYIIAWMNLVGVKIYNTQMPTILGSESLSIDVKKDIEAIWEKQSPKDYRKFVRNRNL